MPHCTRCLVALVFLAACATPGASRPPPASSSAATPVPAAQPRTPPVSVSPAPGSTPAAIGTFDTAGTMSADRAAHTATALPDGSVLVAGGFAGQNQRYHASAEVYDPPTQSFAPTGSMRAGRAAHTATLLADGQVLIAGGFNGDYLADAEVYNPATGQFRPTGALTTARSDHVAVLLPNGKVLVAGGVGTGWAFLADAELYDPARGAWTRVGAMTVPRESHTMTLLADGTVLVAGGHQGRRRAIIISASTELYDPHTNTFTVSGAMTVARHKHDAVLLADGDVLITGGADARDDQGAYRSAERYDTATHTFVATAPMPTARYKHRDTSVVLPNGLVLLAGGARRAALYDPANDAFRTVTGSLGSSRFSRLFAAATLLPDGTVLLTGGYGLGEATSAGAWRYSSTPAASDRSPTLPR